MEIYCILLYPAYFAECCFQVPTIFLAVTVGHVFLPNYTVCYYLGIFLEHSQNREHVAINKKDSKENVNHFISRNGKV